jgi:hypothetical protein
MAERRGEISKVKLFYQNFCSHISIVLQPVLVSGVHENMTSHLWTPEGFENEFGMKSCFCKEL